MADNAFEACQSHSSPDAVAGATSKSQYVFFVRHGQSRWNAAQESFDVLSMYWENDHGLSAAGRAQAEELRQRLAIARVESSNQEWTQRLCEPDAVFVSPFTRAIQTAALGLPDILSQRPLRVMKEAREQKSLGGADCRGVAVGEGIVKRARADLASLFYDQAARERAVDEFDKLSVDTSDAREEWWNDTMDFGADVDEKLKRFLEKLSKQPDGSSSVVVGHSYMFRTLFQKCMQKEAHMKHPSIGASLCGKVLPCCGVVGCKFEFSKNMYEIRDVAVLAGTKLEPMEPDGWTRYFEGGCCGRARHLEPSPTAPLVC